MQKSTSLHVIYIDQKFSISSKIIPYQRQHLVPKAHSAVQKKIIPFCITKIHYKIQTAQVNVSCPSYNHPLITLCSSDLDVKIQKKESIQTIRTFVRRLRRLGSEQEDEEESRMIE